MKSYTVCNKSPIRIYITELINAVVLLSGTNSDPCWATAVLARRVFGGCLSPFGLLLQNTTDRGAYK